MTATPEIPVELHVKVCKKIAQLTKVIYTLNSRADEQHSILEKLKVTQKNDLNKVMCECKQKVLKFRLQSQEVVEKENEVKMLHQLFDELKIENSRLQETLKEHAENTTLNEKQLQTDYENKYLDLQNQFLERKRNYEELLESFHTFQQEVEIKTEEKLTALTIKHHEELKTISVAHQAEVDDIVNNRLKSEQKINEKMTECECLHMQWEIEKKQLETEHESKINKMKSFYEKEMELLESRKSKDSEEKWENNKLLLVAEFQLAKSELNNRIRFLEKQSSEKDSDIQQCKNNSESLNLKSNSYITQLSTLQSQLDEKMVEVSSLACKLIDLQQKLTNSEEESLSEINQKVGMYQFYY